MWWRARRLRRYVSRLYLHNRQVAVYWRVLSLWHRLGRLFTRSGHP
jgi:hypothetical protein